MAFRVTRPADQAAGALVVVGHHVEVAGVHGCGEAHRSGQEQEPAKASTAEAQTAEAQTAEAKASSLLAGAVVACGMLSWTVTSCPVLSRPVLSRAVLSRAVLGGAGASWRAAFRSARLSLMIASDPGRIPIGWVAPSERDARPG